MTALVSLNSVPGADAREPSSTVLEISGGLHQGVSLVLDKPVYRVGSSSDSDLVLSDSGIAAQHLVLRLSDDRVAIEAVGGEVGLQHATGLRVIKQGHGQRVSLPVEITVGRSRLRLRDTRPLAVSSAAPQLVPALNSRHLAVLAAVLLMALCTLAYAFRSEPHPVLAPELSNAPARAGNSPAATPPTPEQAHAWLVQSLQDAELGHLHTDVSGRQISVEGSYPVTLKQRWLGVQQAFDAQFGQYVVLTPKVQATAVVAKPRVRFQAVWFGDNPYVIDEHGKRLYPGATLTDSWVLEGIEGNEVRMTRGHERFVFTL